MSAVTPSKRDLFERLRGLDPAQRAARLASECPDPGLRAEVARLLDADARAGDPIGECVQQAADRSAALLAPASHLGPWRLLGLLGEGGMGAVWLAERIDGEYRKQAAIKVIRGVASPDAIERFRRERQVLAGLEHPHIARLLDGGTTPDGEPYLVMEYVEGQPLGAWCSRLRPSLRARLQLFAQLCRAVHFAHQHLVVHCDLKPGNVLVRSDGTPALLDFGIARLLDAHGAAHATRIAGTRDYASPEQLLGGSVTASTDVFGLGMVLYELLAGSVPERPRDASLSMTELPAPSRWCTQTGDPAVGRALRGDLDSIVRRATRSEPGQRYASAAALAGDVDAWLDGRPVAAAGGHWRYLAGKFVRRHRWGVALGALALLALLSLSVLLALQNRAVRDALARAEREAAAAQATTVFLEGLFGELDPRNAPGRQLAPRALVDLGVQRLGEMRDLDPARRGRLARSLAALYRSIGAPDAALPLLDQAEAGLGPEADAERLAIGIDRTRDLLSAIRHDEALRSADAALLLARRLRDRRSEADLLGMRGTARQNLAIGAGHGVADHDAAEAIYRSLGAEGEDGLTVLLYRRAIVAEQAGEHELALARYREAHARRSAQYGPDHPSALSNQFGIGKVLNMLGRGSEARVVLDDLYTRSARVHGARTEPMQRAAAELATALRNTGEFEAAAARYREAIDILGEVTSGRETVQLSLHLGNLAMLEEMRGDLDAARRLFERGREIRRALYPPDSPWLANSAHFLARVALAAGDLDAAQREIDTALHIRRAQLAPDHFERLMSEGLGLEIAALRRTPVPPETEAGLRAALAATPAHRARLALLRGLSAAAAARDDAHAAAALVRDEIALLRATYAEQHALVGEAQWRLAALLRAAGDAAAARDEARAAAALLSRTQVPASPLYRAARAVLAARTVP